MTIRYHLQYSLIQIDVVAISVSCRFDDDLSAFTAQSNDLST